MISPAQLAWLGELPLSCEGLWGSGVRHSSSSSRRASKHPEGCLEQEQQQLGCCQLLFKQQPRRCNTPPRAALVYCTASKSRGRV